ncbi:hypothetical protein E8L99_11735 [Phreatobacter aquaticus]|uniref:Uncharacterized protein n=1 Tax=Phreatobacter aquaticus TaxID=2570229 RepID=A0A4D7QHJ2_9HYPH|nr:hypothetical protein E8L99_11735 [Phreatobacter aquaticus]
MPNRPFQFVMPALVAGIHVLSLGRREDVDGRDKSGHDVEGLTRQLQVPQDQSYPFCARFLR